jgi:hypothetical protein
MTILSPFLFFEMYKLSKASKVRIFAAQLLPTARSCRFHFLSLIQLQALETSFLCGTS